MSNKWNCTSISRARLDCDGAIVSPYISVKFSLLERYFAGSIHRKVCQAQRDFIVSNAQNTERDSVADKEYTLILESLLRLNEFMTFYHVIKGYFRRLFV